MLLNTKTVIKCFKIVILNTICIMMDINPWRFFVDRIWPLSEWKLNSKDHVIFNKFLSNARAFLPQWSKSASARASVSLAPVLGARALKTGGTICQTLLQWILPQWVLPQWGLVCHHHKGALDRVINELNCWFDVRYMLANVHAH